MCANYIAGVATGEVLLVVASYSQLDFAGAATDSKPPFEYSASSSIPYFCQFENKFTSQFVTPHSAYWQACNT
jgi:hypothetical protein